MVKYSNNSFLNYVPKVFHQTLNLSIVAFLVSGTAVKFGKNSLLKNFNIKLCAKYLLYFED